MTNNEIKYKKILPDGSISNFVECFWLIENSNGVEKEIVVIPDGNFDMVLFKEKDKPFQIGLRGLDTTYMLNKISANTKMFFINFKLLAVEYVFHNSIANLINGGQIFPDNFWDFNENDLNDFEKFTLKATNTILQIIPKEIDVRKQKLFELIYSSNGSMQVQELSEKVFWSSRQINRYFTQYFGVTLKSYCNILRFRASFVQIKEGNLFPEQDFADQAHFSKEIKKLSGVNPRELHRNANDRYIQVSISDRK